MWAFLLRKLEIWLIEKYQWNGSILFGSLFAKGLPLFWPYLMSQKSYCHEPPAKRILLRAARIKQIQINVDSKFILATKTYVNYITHINIVNQAMSIFTKELANHSALAQNSACSEHCVMYMFLYTLGICAYWAVLQLSKTKETVTILHLLSEPEISFIWIIW